MSEYSIIGPSHHDVYPAISPAHTLKGAAKGKIVLITGGGTGIGKAIAHAFAQANAKIVIITGRRIEKLEVVKASIETESQACRVLALSCDVKDDKSVENLFAELNTQGLAVDVLINNAGTRESKSQIVDSDPKTWWGDYETNLKGPYLLSRAFLRSLPHSSTKAKTIINVSSASSYALLPLSSSYGPSKATLNRLTEWLQSESAASGVTCIAVHPGGVQATEMTQGAPDFMKCYLNDTAQLGAGAMVWLSSAGREWLGGRYVDMRWDVDELEGLREMIVEGDLLKMGMVGTMRPRLNDKTVFRLALDARSETVPEELGKANEQAR